MSFSASTCLINTGTTTLGPILVLHSNIDGYLTPFGTVNTSDIIGGNCPYVITNIPDGTTIIRLSDAVSKCCAYIEILSDEICNTCDLGFTLLSGSTIGQIVAGNLTGSCQNITDYVINWYGSDNSVKYTSGSGNQFNYTFPHPLTGEGKTILAQADTYTPIIDKIILSGFTFSQTGGTDSGVYKVKLDCFEPVVVNPLTCGNNNINPNINPFYNYFFSQNVITETLPVPVGATFELNTNIKYFGWRFKGDNIPDTLRLIFSGSSYSEQITLDYITVGSDLLSSNFLINTFPKSADTNQFIQRVVCLTGLTINAGDRLLIEITPSQSNPQTSWDIYFKCFEEFDCSLCTDIYLNTPYKIIFSSITATTDCENVLNVKLSLSGCSDSEFLNSDSGKYIFNQVNNFLVSRDNGLFFGSLGGSELYYNRFNCSRSNPGGFPQGICSSPSTGIITFQKTIGNIFMTFSLESDFLTYYNSYLNQLPNSGNTTDNTSFGYYRYYYLQIPSGSTCGDSVPRINYAIHPSSTLVTGYSDNTSTYTINIDLSGITIGTGFTSCDINCNNFVQEIVNSVNFSYSGITGSTFISGPNTTLLTTTSSKYINPFSIRTITGTTSTVTATTDEKFFSISSYVVNTYPTSGMTNTIISSLSGKTCNFDVNSRITPQTSNSPFRYTRHLFYGRIRLLNPSNINDYAIDISPITNGTYSGTPTNINYVLNTYVYSGGSGTINNPEFYVI